MKHIRKYNENLNKTDALKTKDPELVFMAEKDYETSSDNHSKIVIKKGDTIRANNYYYGTSGNLPKNYPVITNGGHTWISIEDIIDNFKLI